MSDHQCLVFKPFLLDLRDERLWQGSEVVRIGAKAFAVLHCLLTQAGQLVTKETLLETVWPETVVGEAVLTVVIRELRQALGDQAHKPQFIETVRGRGYRFIAPVTMVHGPSGTYEAREIHSPSQLSVMAPSGIFVGRETEVAQVHRWFTKALQGERQIVFIAGEPGVGKTALVASFVANLTATEHVWVGHGQCIDHYGAGEAYLPILEALARLCRGPEAGQLVVLLRQYAPSWLVQMPALLSPAEREALGRSMSGVTQARMLRELAEALEVLTAVRPLVLVLEDLHWSDPSTLAFLTYVARRRDRAHVLVLGTYRPADVIRQAHPLRRVIAELRQHHQCVDTTLASLPEAAITVYVRERFGAKAVPEELVRLLYQRSSGNPLFFTALVDELLQRGILEESRDTLHMREGMATVSGIVPESLHLLITQQVEQLSSEDQAVLEAASVAGMTFSVAAVAAAVDLAMSAIEARCAAWARQGWLVHDHGTETWPDGTVAACYGFRHALYHEVILARISPGQRIHLHRHIGHRKERAYADQTQVIAAELAVHFEQAREILRAVSYRHKAAETALQRSAYAEAITHLTQGLPPQATYLFKHALIQDTAYQSLLRSTRQQHHQRIAQVLEAHFPERCETQPELLAHHYTEAGLSAQAIPYWQRAGQRASERSAHVEAIAHLTRGLEVLNTLPDTLERTQQELVLQTTLGPALLATKGYAAPEVGRVYARAQELCQQVGETSQIFSTLYGLYYFHMIRAELHRAQALAEQLLRMAHHHHDRSLLLLAHLALTGPLFHLGELTRSRPHLEQGLGLYDAQQHHALAFRYGIDPGVYFLSHGARHLWLLGFPEQARTSVREALTLARTLAHPFSLAFALHWATTIHQWRREAPAAQEQAEMSMAFSREQGFALWVPGGIVLRGWALTAQGQMEEGIAHMRQGMTAWQATGAEVDRPYYLALLAEGYGKAGRAEAGLHVLAEALAVVDTIEERYYEAELYRLQGELLLARSTEQHTEAATCFRQALDIARRQQARSWELRAAVSLARLWQRQGKRAEAHDLLAPVYGWFTEGFDTADLQEAKALLDALA